MKLVQLNCWGGKLETAIGRLIKEVDPDFVCLQEAIDLTSRPGSVISPFTDFLPENKYPFSFFAPVFSQRYMHEITGLGNAVVSKFPFIKTYSAFTRGQFIEDMDSLKDDYNVRNFVHAEVKVGGKKLNILTHHGHHNPEHKDGGPENTRQMQIIADYIKKLKDAVIIAGDFNLHPKSPSLDPLNKILINLPVKYGLTSTRSELAKRQEVIDYIMASRDVKIKNFLASEKIVSDHKALILEFDI